MQSSSVSVCVINYNGIHYLGQTLDSILGQDRDVCEVIMVDNDSSDGSVDFVRQHYPAVGITQLDHNRGPSATRDVGWQIAKGDRILFVDNDVALEKSSLALLNTILDAYPRAVAAMPAVCYDDRPQTIQYDGAGVHYLGQMILHHEGEDYVSVDKHVRFIDTLVSACLLVDRQRCNNVSPFDPSFFIYFDDLDMGLRLRLQGHDLLSVPTSRVTHRAGTVALSLRATGQYAPVRVVNLIANRWRVMAKAYDARTLMLLLPMLLVYELAQLLIVVRKGWLAYWLQSLAQIWQDRADIAIKRCEMQMNRNVRDREVLVGGPLPFAAELTSGKAEEFALHLLNLTAEAYWRIVRDVL